MRKNVAAAERIEVRKKIANFTTEEEPQSLLETLPHVKRRDANEKFQNFPNSAAGDTSAACRICRNPNLRLHACHAAPNS